MCEKPPTKIFESDIAMVDTDLAGNRLSQFLNQKKEELGAKMTGYKSKFWS